MKRDQSISVTYLPPLVRVVDAYAEQAILADSKVNVQSLYSVDEIESIERSDSEKLWIEF